MTTVGQVQCGVCGINLLAEWIRMRQRHPHIEVQWQLLSGICVHCHVDRWQAAREYDHAAAEVRLYELLGAAGDSRAGRQALTAAIHRVQDADARCVELGMWPATRSTRRPLWFYGDERSNT